MNKYIIRIDENNNILTVLYTFDYAEEDIELTQEEYQTALKHLKFDKQTRTFSEPIKEQEEVVLMKETSIEEKLNTIMMHLGLG